MEALKIVKENGITSPFLVVTTTMSEKFAMSVIEEGASDYVLKDSLHRLPDAIKNALEKYSFTNQESILTDAISITEKLYDLSLLEEMDDNEYIIEIVSIFLNETPKELAEMQKAAISGNIAMVCNKAHKLKSSTGLIQANGLLQILKNIEETANSSSADELIKLVKTAVAKYKTIETSLREHLQILSHKPTG